MADKQILIEMGKRSSLFQRPGSSSINITLKPSTSSGSIMMLILLLFSEKFLCNILPAFYSDCCAFGRFLNSSGRNRKFRIARSAGEIKSNVKCGCQMSCRRRYKCHLTIHLILPPGFTQALAVEPWFFERCFFLHPQTSVSSVASQRHLGYKVDSMIEREQAKTAKRRMQNLTWCFETCTTSQTSSPCASLQYWWYDNDQYFKFYDSLLGQ